MNNLTVAQGTAVAAPSTAWGTEGVSSRDIEVPRLQLMHDISQLVKDRKANAGDLVSSLTGQVLAKREMLSGVEFMPIKSFREWIINEVDEKGRDKFSHSVPMDATNENWAPEDVVNGKPIRRVKALNFFGVLVKDLKAIPHVIQFKKSSYRAGKQLITHFKTCEMQGKPGASQVFRLGTTQRTFDGYTFFVLTVEPIRPSTDEELAEAYNWYKMLTTASVKVAGENAQSSDDAPDFG